MATHPVSRRRQLSSMQKSKVPCIALLLALAAPATLVASSPSVARRDLGDDVINEEDFRRLSALFVASGCDAQRVLRSSAELGLSDTWRNLYDEEEAPLRSLSPGSLCLISRSTDFVVYGRGFKAETKSSHGKTWARNTFPVPFDVVEVQFSLPEKAQKECARGESAGSPYIIVFKKTNGRIQRTVFSNENADEECFIRKLNLPSGAPVRR